MSDAYLEIACREIKKFCTTITPIESRLENLAHCLSYPRSNQAFIMLGLTFMNFNGHYISNLLSEISGNIGSVIIASELYDDDTSGIVSQYEVSEIKNFAFGPLSLLGLDIRDFEHAVEFSEGRVELIFIPRTDIKIGSKSILRGNKIVTAVSYRYRKKEIVELLSHYFCSQENFLSQDKQTLLSVCRP